MIYYLVKSQPPRLVATQKEAQDTGLPFEDIDTPKDKYELMEWINQTISTQWQAATDTSKKIKECPACARSLKAATIMAGILAKTDLEEVVLTMTQEWQLDGLIGVIEERRREIVPAKPAIRKRDSNGTPQAL